MKQKVIFRADGNSKIGYGHFIRTLGIASIINQEFECVYATTNPSEYQYKEIKKACNSIIELDQNENVEQAFIDKLKGNEIVVLDNYTASESYQLAIRSKGCKLIYIDDFNDKNYVCDALINNIPGFATDSFKKASYTKLFLGPDYAMLRLDFFNTELRNIKKLDQHFFISLGGSDIFNISHKLIKFVFDLNPLATVNLVIGDAFAHENLLEKRSNLIVHKNIDASNMAKLMAQANYCLIPASSLLNEACTIGSKILLGYYTENQIQPYNYYIEHKVAIPLGNYLELTYNEFKEKITEAENADFLINNQRRIFNYQQLENIKTIFRYVQQY